jgi:hypothetical protein
VHDAPLEPDAPDERLRPRPDRVALHEIAVLGRAPDEEGDPEDVAVRLVDVAALRPAQADGVAHHGLEHRLEAEVGTTDDLEHLARGHLLLARIGQLALELRDALIALARRLRLSRHDDPLVRLPRTVRA